MTDPHTDNPRERAIKEVNARKYAELSAFLASQNITRRAAGFGPLPIASRVTPEQLDAALRVLPVLWDHEQHAHQYVTPEQQDAVAAVSAAVREHDAAKATDPPEHPGCAHVCPCGNQSWEVDSTGRPQRCATCRRPWGVPA